jgi:hypothetical protein
MSVITRREITAPSGRVYTVNNLRPTEGSELFDPEFPDYNFDMTFCPNVFDGLNHPEYADADRQIQEDGCVPRCEFDCHGDCFENCLAQGVIAEVYLEARKTAKVVEE